MNLKKKYLCNLSIIIGILKVIFDYRNNRR